MERIFEPHAKERDESAARENGWYRFTVREIEPAPDTQVEFTWVLRPPVERTLTDIMVGIVIVTVGAGVVWLLADWKWGLATFWGWLLFGWITARRDDRGMR